MKLAIVGCRHYHDYEALEARILGLYDVSQIELIISGGAEGVDTLAEQFARKHNIPIRTHLPDWDRHGRRAGPFRNKLIAADCDEMVAFWDGKSAGTRSAISEARKLFRVKVHVVKIPAKRR